MSTRLPPRLVRWRRRFLTTLFLSATLTIFLAVDHHLPIHSYIPYCPGPRDPETGTWIDGPYRERFLWLTRQVLEERGATTLIYQGNLYTNGAIDAEYSPPELHYVYDHLNTDHHLAAVIARGLTIDDVYFPPPERLVRLLKKKEPQWGPWPKLDEYGNPILGPDERFIEDCELFKAAVLKDEAFAEPAAPAK